MTPAEQADEDERWYLAEDARCAAEDATWLVQKREQSNLTEPMIRRAVEIPTARPRLRVVR